MAYFDVAVGAPLVLIFTDDGRDIDVVWWTYVVLPAFHAQILYG